jgi:purine-binding chemotaxis protein CheW
MTGGADIQAVVFSLGGEMFALPVGTVREILDHRAAFRMPQGPPWFAGLIDVRGEAVPMVDLRIRLGLAAAEIGVTTRILVIDVPLDDRPLKLGLLVDRVLDVASFAWSTIETAPDIGVRWRSDYIDGVVRRQDGFVVLLAAASIFSAEDEALALSGLDQAA